MNNMKEKQAYVYILSNLKDTVFYTGSTIDLKRRMYEHVNKLADGFTKKYNITKLLYYEVHTNYYNALSRERLIKRWKREWKWNIIDSVNPERVNLYQNGEILGIDPATSAG